MWFLLPRSSFLFPSSPLSSVRSQGKCHFLGEGFPNLSVLNRSSDSLINASLHTGFYIPLEQALDLLFSLLYP